MVGSNPPLCRAPAGISIRGQAHLAAGIITPIPAACLLPIVSKWAKIKDRLKLLSRLYPTGCQGKMEPLRRFFRIRIKT